MPNRSEIPPVPTAGQVAPLFVFIGVALIGGIVFVVGGTREDNWPLLIVGAFLALASAAWLVDAVRSLLRLIRLNRQP